VKQALRQLLSDFLSAILFLVVYAVSGSPFAAGGIAVAAGLGQLIRLKLTHRQIEPMQWMSLGLVVVLGSATMLTAECRPREGGASPLRTLLAAFWGRVNEPQISKPTANSSCSKTPRSSTAARPGRPAAIRIWWQVFRELTGGRSIRWPKPDLARRTPVYSVENGHSDNVIIADCER